ncbi:MAG: hypothetical protein R3F37_02280 [Candidatus Competibacteraceae bacterium]
MTVTLHNPAFDGFHLEFWQAAYLALESYLAGPPEPEGYQHGIDYDLEVNDGDEVKLKIWREQSGQVHIQCLSIISNETGYTLDNIRFDTVVAVG